MKISELTKKRIEELIREDKRMDGRKPLEFRDVSLEFGISKKAEGSARIKLGDTEVVVGVKLNVGEPYTDSPDSGSMMVTVEMWPLASEKFDMGPPDIRAIELARLVDRGIRESEFIDFKKLCVKKGEVVWTVFIDIFPLNDDGNLIDASAIAAAAALKTAVFPVIKGDKVQFGELTTKKLPLKNIPIALTFYKVDNKILLDPTPEEEEASKARVTVTMTFDKEVFIHAMQKAGDEPLDEQEISKILDIAVKEGKKLFDKVVKQIK